MPGYLQGFEYDIFISYGWAGAQQPDEGDRGWVAAFAERLQTEMRSRLDINRCELFLDRDASRNGYLSDNLARALSSSGVLLFVVSPGSCRPDSWCRFEAAHFLDTAQPVAHPSLFREDRLFKLELRKVDPADEPPQIARCVPYSFADSRFNTPLPIEEIGDRGSLSYDSFHKLCQDLDKLLRRARKLQDTGKPASGKFVFVGAVPDALTENRNRRISSLECQGHRAILATPIAGESPADFAARTGQALARADTSVHLFGTPVLYGPSAAQCRAALSSPASKVYIWRDRTVTLDPAHEAFLADLQRTALDVSQSGRVEFPQGGADSYLDPNLVSDLSHAHSPAPAADQTFHGCTVMLHFDVKDGTNIDGVVQLLNAKGIEVQPPLFGGSRKQRDDTNAELSRQAAAVAVFFGSASDLWAFQSCDRVSSIVAAQPKPAAVILAPPPGKPASKKLWKTPKPLTKLDCQGADWGDLEDWADEVLRGCRGA